MIIAIHLIPYTYMIRIGKEKIDCFYQGNFLVLNNCNFWKRFINTCTCTKTKTNGIKSFFIKHCRYLNQFLIIFIGAV